MTGRRNKTGIINALCADSLLRQPQLPKRRRHCNGPAQKTILIVEDDPIVGQELKATLLDAGHKPTGPVRKMDTAINLVQSQPIDAAILDLHLAGQDIYPLAKLLEQRHIPFMFYTGCVLADALKPYFPLNPVCIKPQSAHQLMIVLTEMLSSPA